MTSVRRWAFLFLLSASAACNAITGAHDRFLDVEEEDSSVPDRPDTGADGGGGTGDAATDAPADTSDGAPIVIPVDVGGAWTSPNGAMFATVDGGKKITAFDAGATHPVIVPVTQPAIPAEDYTVHATIRGPSSLGEFGILARVQADRSAVLLSSSYGQQPSAFVGNISSVDWNPTNGQQLSYTFVPDTRYELVVRVTGNEVRAKFWPVTATEPATFQLLFVGAYAKGRGVGFYTYGVVDAVLEDMFVTVP